MEDEVCLLQKNCTRTIMNAQNGRSSFSDGDIFEVGNCPITRMKVLELHWANGVATIHVCYSSAQKMTPTVKIRTASSGGCHPVLTEGAVVTFEPAISGLKCSQGYSAVWTVAGANPMLGQHKNATKFSITLPDPTVVVTVSVTVTFDDGAVVSDSLQFNPFSLAEASFREFICKLLQERMKPIPWWEWEPERLRSGTTSYSREELAHAVRVLERALRQFIMISVKLRVYEVWCLKRMSAESPRCLSFAKSRFICLFNKFACHSPNQKFRDQNLILA